MSCTSTSKSASPLFFYFPVGSNGFLCQWYPSEFICQNGNRFVTAEQWMMYQKALTFGDFDTAVHILAAPDPAEQQRLGRQVKGFRRAEWDRVKTQIVEEGNWLKFSQNSWLRAKLLATEDRELVESGEKCRIWGIGYPPDEALRVGRDAWGENLLGKALMNTRDSQKLGIQLAHAGRKASCIAPWLGEGATATEAVGGWPENVYGPSVIQGDDYPHPKEASVEYTKSVVEAFAASAKRAVQAGIDVIEIRTCFDSSTHDSFLNPVSNRRTDQYGGSFENRTRLTIVLVDAIRAVIPKGMSLFLRESISFPSNISASDGLEEALPKEPSWTSADTVRLAPILPAHGVDFLDVTSAGTYPLQKINFAVVVKEAVGDKLFLGAVDGITSGKEAQEVLEGGKVDGALVGRWFQKNPALVWTFAEELERHVWRALRALT
ncbi:DUF1768-domain-containing protein [Athelia psychrophila]|uniref:DUF1768-domain-containing protein n=1 Tax=Athelia psychrophila TaxID=1759441 RepID=A0A166A315_9AGAM|nr:DUF1768-domain-containing protein [Fibularhizoctonia sp. CBS 109695]